MGICVFRTFEKNAKHIFQFLHFPQKRAADIKQILPRVTVYSRAPLIKFKLFVRAHFTPQVSDRARREVAPRNESVTKKVPLPIS